MKEAVASGFTGFRGTGDLSGCVNNVASCSQMPEYESALDRYFPKGSNRELASPWVTRPGEPHPVVWVSSEDTQARVLDSQAVTNRSYGRRESVMLEGDGIHRWLKERQEPRFRLAVL